MSSGPGTAVPGSIVPASSLVSPGGVTGRLGLIGLPGLQGVPGSNAPSADTGNIASAGSDSLLYTPFTGSYFGTDTTNNASYSVTVDPSFKLVPGVRVFVLPSNANVSSPFPNLTVNGFYGGYIYSKYGNNILSPREIVANKLFGVVYDGISGNKWRLFTWVCRYFTQAGAGLVKVDCGGYDAVAIYASNTAVGFSFTVQLLNVADGVPITLCLYTTQTGTNWNFVSGSTDSAGNTIAGAFEIWTNSINGVAAVNIMAATAITQNYNLFIHGCVMQGNFYFK